MSVTRWDDVVAFVFFPVQKCPAALTREMVHTLSTLYILGHSPMSARIGD